MRTGCEGHSSASCANAEPTDSECELSLLQGADECGDELGGHGSKDLGNRNIEGRRYTELQCEPRTSKPKFGARTRKPHHKNFNSIANYHSDNSLAIRFVPWGACRYILTRHTRRAPSAALAALPATSLLRSGADHPYHSNARAPTEGKEPRNAVPSVTVAASFHGWAHASRQRDNSASERTLSRCLSPFAGVILGIRSSLPH